MSTPEKWEVAEGSNSFLGPVIAVARSGECHGTPGMAVCIIAQKSKVDEIDRRNAHMISAVPELIALARRVANLNENAGEIGAGMLNQLVLEARNAIRKATETKS